MSRAREGFIIDTREHFTRELGLDRDLPGTSQPAYGTRVTAC